MKIIIELIKLAISAGIVAFAIYFIYLFTTIKIKRYKFEKSIKRRLDLIEALRNFWLDNYIIKKRKLSIDDEMAEMELISIEGKTNRLFKKCLRKSKISYCYEYYLKTSKTNHSYEILRKTKERTRQITKQRQENHG